MNTPEKYPLQSYLQVIILQTSMSIQQLSNPNSWKLLGVVSDQMAKAAQIFLGALPILLVYPFVPLLPFGRVHPERASHSP